MSGPVFAAVLLAALLHACWNALVKSGSDKHLAMAAVTLGHVPVAIAVLAVSPMPAPESLPWLAASMMLHMGYQLFLISAYRIGDLTQVYPIARGSAPLIVAGVSVGFLGVHLARLELLGIVIIAAGLFSIALVRQRDGLRNHRAALLALVTGCFIAAYSLVDGIGARVAGTALGFFGWAAIGNAVLFALLTAWMKPGLLSRIPREAPGTCLLGGLASFTAYALVVWAFTQAPIALVSALRETSIVFALLIGTVVLRERLDLAKVVSTLITLFGAALLRVSRG